MVAIATAALGATSAYYLKPWLALEQAAATTATAPANQLASGRHAHLQQYQFKSAALGWAIDVDEPNRGEDDLSGSFRTFKTVDGGRHWQKGLAGKTESVWVTLSSLFFADASTGFLLAGDPLSLYRTRNGGASWNKASGLPEESVVVSQFTDARHGWLTVGATMEPDAVWHVYATENGGDNWRRVSDPPALNYAPTFRGAAEGWSGASSPEGTPHVFETSDGGTTWQRLDLPVDAAPGATSTWVNLPPQSGALVYAYKDQEPPVTITLTTFDHGISWQPAGGLFADQDFGSLGFEDARHWWLVRDLALYKSADAGRSWTRFADAQSNLYLTQVMDARHAWAQLDDGYGVKLLFTNDGGLHWTATPVPVS